MSTRRKSADPSPLVGEGVGRIAYEAYSEVVGGHSVKGDVLPRWEDQTRDNPQVATAWCAAAQAVLSATFERNEA